MRKERRKERRIHFGTFVKLTLVLSVGLSSINKEVIIYISILHENLCKPYNELKTRIIITCINKHICRD